MLPIKRVFYEGKFQINRSFGLIRKYFIYLSGQDIYLPPPDNLPLESTNCIKYCQMENLNQFSIQSILSNILPGFLANIVWYIFYIQTHAGFVKDNQPLAIFLIIFISIISGQI